MKKYNKFGYAGAMLLAGLVSFSACSSDDELADVNPTYDGESVKTQFTISVPRAAKSGRMTGTNVQHDGENFRGMENIKLYPFKTAGAGTLVDGSSSYTVAANRIDLPFIASGTTTENPSNKIGAKMYTNVSIPVHTNAFLLYGEAIRNGQDDFVNGNIDASYLEDDANMDIRQKVGSIKFNLKPITTATHTNQGEDAAAGAAILNLLNGVAKAQGWSAASAETALGKAYKAFTGNTVGSSEGVRLMMQDLYNNMQTILAAGTNDVASAVSNAILGDYGVATLVEEGNEVLGSKKLKYKTTSFKFPDKLLIPDGAVQVIWNTSAFEYAQDVNIGVQNNGVATAEWNRYVYPASLYYMANSSIAVSNTTKGSIDVSNQDWGAFLSGNYDSSGAAGAVQNTTQSIAMIDKINYAVGVLETKVQLSTKNPPKDHNKQDITELNCQLTGVLVGGQKSVDWNFAPVDATEYTIYDKTANEDITKLTTNPSNVAFYTLAMPTAKDKPVMVALEFVNKGTKAIKCASGYIPVEGKFYLVGKLDPQSGKTYAQDGTNAVFMKDYLTKATFKVTASSLDNAYPVIPDLRTPELELGLAVDLDWKQGLLFEVEM